MEPQGWPLHCYDSKSLGLGCLLTFPPREGGGALSLELRLFLSVGRTMF